MSQNSLWKQNATVLEKVNLLKRGKHLDGIQKSCGKPIMSLLLGAPRLNLDRYSGFNAKQNSN